MKRGCEPPFVPTLTSDDDVSNFDTRFTSKSPRESDVSSATSPSSNGQKTAKDEGQHKEDLGMFNDFDYVAPEFLAEQEKQDQEKMLPSELQDLRIRGYGD